MNTASGVLVGVDGMVGLEYTLEDIPLNFAVRCRTLHSSSPAGRTVLLERRLFSKVHLLAYIYTPI